MATSFVSASSPPELPQVVDKASKIHIVGGAVGVVSASILVAVITITVVILKWKKTRKLKHICEDSRAIENEIYDAGNGKRNIIYQLIVFNLKVKMFSFSSEGD